MATTSPQLVSVSTDNANKPLDQFHRLVSDLKRALGPSSGLDSEDVSLADLKALMDAYISNSTEWKEYAFEDPTRAYTRNLVDTGNGKSNLLILVWTPGKGSPIHDHADAHCLMKVLKGSLKETVYTWPDRNAVNDGQASPLKVMGETTHRQNEVAYMSDDLGLHAISNPSMSDFAVSLHLYTPPNAAKVGCHTYEKQTGKSSHVKKCSFYSDHGNKS